MARFDTAPKPKSQPTFDFATPTAPKPDYSGVRPQGVRTNKYSGKCSDCGGFVEAEAGRLDKMDGGIGHGSQWVVSHLVCPDPEVATEAALDEYTGIWPGVYTLVKDGETHRTFRVRVQSREDDFAPGETVLEFLSGPDNTKDYTSFAFIKPGNTLSVWKRFREDDVLRADARTFLADPESALEAKNCLRCNALLSNPESIASGFGSECIKKGW